MKNIPLLRRIIFYVAFRGWIIHFYQKHISKRKNYHCAHASHHGGESCSCFVLKLTKEFGDRLGEEQFVRIDDRLAECRRVSVVSGLSDRQSIWRMFTRFGLSGTLIFCVVGCGGGGPTGTSANSSSNSTPTPTPTPNPTPGPTPSPSPSAPSVQLLGVWQTIEGTGFDIVFLGTDAGLVSGASLSGRECEYQTQKSTNTARLFRCISPEVPSGSDTAFNNVSVRYSNGASTTQTGPFYFRSQASWIKVNGQFYVESLWNYLLNASATEGPIININMRPISGNYGDLPSPAYFGALKLSGSGKEFICKTTGNYEYKCPPMPEGKYSVEILHDQLTRYVVDNYFTVQVVYGALDTPAPNPVPAPTPVSPPSTTPTPPQCDPMTTKGC